MLRKASIRLQDASQGFNKASRRFARLRKVPRTRFHEEGPGKNPKGYASKGRPSAASRVPQGTARNP